MRSARGQGFAAPVFAMEHHTRQLSSELNYDNVEEVDDAYDVVEPAYVLVYRRVERPEGADSRFVSVIRVEVTRRFWKRIFGQATAFVEATVFFWDMDDREQWRPVTVPSVFTFDETPPSAEAKTVVTQNRTLFRHFAPILKGGATMRLLYERPLFKIRAETERLEAEPKSARKNSARGAGAERLREAETRLQRGFNRLKIRDDHDSLNRDGSARSVKSLETLKGSIASAGLAAQSKRKTFLGRIAGSRPQGSRPGSRPTRDVVPQFSKIPHVPHRRRADRKKFSLEVDPHDTVRELKRKIYQTRGYQPSIQQLVFNGVALSDEDRLVDFEIGENSTLMLWLRNEDGTMKRVDL